MADPYVNVDSLKENLALFFEEQKGDLARFGNTVNQTFEAYVFASTVAWYRSNDWKVALVHPKDDHGKTRTHCHLKFSTNGAPRNYSYARCSKKRKTVQVRHQLRVATAHFKLGNRYSANVCLDVAVIRETDLGEYESRTQLPNDHLITFGEAKHMSAFAELIAGFIGMVFELQPGRLTKGPHVALGHPQPFLYVSGWLNGTALGLKETIEQRGFDIQIYSVDRKLATDVAINVTPKRRKPSQKKAPVTT